ncbi:hypothetical protein CYMTET_43195 [Cymbomonas tetramitiformis]|uniref:Helicase C-terminal domain-containing protein n=1 Tax=Cymbomonas tetramitiformis TaxID=36881 RepID=A0AAE0F1V9_9CHLO|nr:hypothetical protein CYMTET_43195 [Cymbomonas tetramitiformis]
MGKSFASHKRQVSEVRRKRTKKNEKRLKTESAVFKHNGDTDEDESESEKEGDTASQNGDDVVARETNAKLPADVFTHSTQIVKSTDRPGALSDYLRTVREKECQKRHKSKIVVFTNSSKAAKTLATTLDSRKMVTYSRGIGRRVESKDIGVCHEDLSPEEQHELCRKFRSGKYHTFVTTDVAGKPLLERSDIISTVINYDFPTDMSIYHDRVRYANTTTGTVLNFFTESKSNLLLAPQFSALLQGANQEVPEQLREVAKMFSASP